MAGCAKPGFPLVGVELQNWAQYKQDGIFTLGKVLTGAQVIKALSSSGTDE